MSKEKQIEEIAKDLCRLTELHCDCGNGRPCFRVLKKAEALYDVGYRKQIEGEWQYPFGDEFSSQLICSKCRVDFLKKEAMYFDYCPNCGAKMKGE